MQTQTDKRDHDFGPWLENVPGIQGKEQRCRKCSAKQWDDNGFRFANDPAKLSCRG